MAVDNKVNGEIADLLNEGRQQNWHIADRHYETNDCTFAYLGIWQHNKYILLCWQSSFAKISIIAKICVSKCIVV